MFRPFFAITLLEYDKKGNLINNSIDLLLKYVLITNNNIDNVKGEYNE